MVHLREVEQGSRRARLWFALPVSFGLNFHEMVMNYG